MAHKIQKVNNYANLLNAAFLKLGNKVQNLYYYIYVINGSLEFLLYILYKT
jgi:hypothetical protein